MTYSKNYNQDKERFPPDIAGVLRKLLPLLPQQNHLRLLDLVDIVLPLSCPTTVAFLQNCHIVIDRAGIDGLETWFQEGLEFLQKSEQSGLAYFSLETSKSMMILESLSSGVGLASTKKVLETYCLALSGRKTIIVPEEETVTEQLTDSQVIILPDYADKYSSKPENFALYKVMATHQAGHIELGSYDLRFDNVASLLHDLSTLADLKKKDEPKTDLAGFLRLFNDRRLATDIFTTVEDGRIDFLIKQRYKGIRQDYNRAQAEALSIRPPLTSHSLRGAFLEVLVQASLERSGKWLVPAVLHPALILAGMIMKYLLSPGTTVEDSAAATIRLYRLTSMIPSNHSRVDNWEVIKFNGSRDNLSMPSLSDVADVLREMPWDSTDLSPYPSPTRVEYRDIFRLKPEREEKDPENREEPEIADSYFPVSSSAGATGNDDFVDIGALAADTDSPEETHVFGISRMNEPDKGLPEQQPEPDIDELSDRALEADGPHSRLYDEWDFRACDYRLKWCRVREVPLDEGNPDFFEATLDEYTRLVAKIRGQFEQLNPQAHRKVTRLYDGEDFDLDAVIDFVTGRKAGQISEPKIYWRKNKTERDVAVAFLLDMSSSTIEYIDRVNRDNISFSPIFPRDYKDYFEWQQSNPEGKLRPKEFKRIIDLEKESIVLLIKALETIGDCYGIYGFSGHGRENVEVYVVKDLEEGFSNRIKNRIDSITPKRGTRMGPALRHATWKLEQQKSKSRFLFLISDGRPEDHGYGRAGLEKDYAINDTKMALLESRKKGITPICLTFDRLGHDYLRTICCDMQYEVLADIESLPTCLPTLYRKFTA